MLGSLDQPPYPGFCSSDDYALQNFSRIAMIHFTICSEDRINWVFMHLWEQGGHGNKGHRANSKSITEPWNHSFVFAETSHLQSQENLQQLGRGVLWEGKGVWGKLPCLPEKVKSYYFSFPVLFWLSMKANLSKSTCKEWNNKLKYGNFVSFCCLSICCIYVK